MAKCRSCGAEIIWTITKNGKRMPLDAKPLEAFNISEAPAHLMCADIVGMAEPVPCYVSHFATCPNADEHRKPREPRGQLSLVDAMDPPKKGA